MDFLQFGKKFYTSDEGFNKVRSAVITETFSVPDMMNPLSILAQKVNNKVK